MLSSHSVRENSYLSELAEASKSPLSLQARKASLSASSKDSSNATLKEPRSPSSKVQDLVAEFEQRATSPLPSPTPSPTPAHRRLSSSKKPSSQPSSPPTEDSLQLVADDPPAISPTPENNIPAEEAVDPSAAEKFASVAAAAREAVIAEAGTADSTVPIKADSEAAATENGKDIPSVAVTEAEPAKEESAADKAEETKAEASDLDRLRETLPNLAETERRKVVNTLNTLPAYPTSLPLTNSWSFYFSDTSSSKHKSHAHTSMKEYTSGFVDLFTANNVPALCSTLKALKLRGRPVEPSGLQEGNYGMSAFRPGQNLTMFRAGIAPVWEDPWNAKGGRVIISPANGLLDYCWERAVLLLAGNSIESDCSAGEGSGSLLGVVGSKRPRGDRVEIWIAGPKVGVPPAPEWLERIRGRLAEELEYAVVSRPPFDVQRSGYSISHSAGKLQEPFLIVHDQAQLRS